MEEQILVWKVFQGPEICTVTCSQSCILHQRVDRIVNALHDKLSVFSYRCSLQKADPKPCLPCSWMRSGLEDKNLLEHAGSLLQKPSAGGVRPES